jgi:hypothetical protein
MREGACDRQRFGDPDETVLEHFSIRRIAVLVKKCGRTGTTGTAWMMNQKLPRR